LQQKHEKYFIYFLEAFYGTHVLSEKIIPLVQFLTEIVPQNIAKLSKTASKNK